MVTDLKMNLIEMRKEFDGVALWRSLFPTRALVLLMGIGAIDLVSTALLHRYGLIVELNPLMRPIIETSEWLFALVKGFTLVLAWLVMVRHYHSHRDFVRTAALSGSCAYVAIWLIWFVGGTITLG